MIDLDTRISMLKRPILLARAARFGLDDYRREIHLRRILGVDTLPRSADALMQLLSIEAEINTQRLDQSGEYHLGRHVNVLIAITGEALLMRATRLRLVEQAPS